MKFVKKKKEIYSKLIKIKLFLLNKSKKKHRKMSKGLFVTPNELSEIIKKRFEKEKNNGEEIDEDNYSGGY